MTYLQPWSCGIDRGSPSGRTPRRRVRFLVDAQLPARLASRLAELGHDVVHTSSLPDGNRTTDQQIAGLADRDGRIVVTKDADFRKATC